MPGMPLSSEHAWHLMDTQAVLTTLSSSLDGLSENQVEQRQNIYGKNILPTKKPPALLHIFFSQFLSPFIYILLAAGFVSILLGDYNDAIFIFFVLLLNAIIGTIQEWKAEKSAAALQNMLKIRIVVRRSGITQELAAEELVPGDIILLQSGNKIPADLRLIQTKNLIADESLLTGEAAAVEKIASKLADDTSLDQHSNMAFAGSIVTAGRGLGVVTATSANTEFGKIATSVMFSKAGKPPLVVRMEQFSRQVSIAMLLSCILLAIMSVLKGFTPTEVFFLAVALAVSAIPEGLPIAITVALSIGTSRMAKRNVIVRKLTAVEGLGSCTCIASDKTGTLTINKQTVKLISLPTGKQYSVTGDGYHGHGEILTVDSYAPGDFDYASMQILAKTAVLCNEARLENTGKDWINFGDAVDVALLALSYKIDLNPLDIRRNTVIKGVIPYESEHKLAAAFYQNEQGGITAAVKGATETLLPFCKYMYTEHGIIDIDIAQVERQVLEMAVNGYRVLAVAEGDTINGINEKPTITDLPKLTLLGLVGFIDPFRPEAKAAVDKCRQAGVTVVMITGDHPATALSIGRQLGIASPQASAVTGQELAAAGPAGSPAFLALVQETLIFARVSPLQKLQIVEALAQLGHIVAVTGDGVNDAPALAKADIGVAMGSGTDVAKDTASLIISDDNFASLVAGIEEGRYTYSNIRKVIALVISTGIAEILLFFFSMLAGLPLPLLAVQLLWLNIVTNGIQDISLAFEAGEADAMQHPPRKPSEGIFDRLMIEEVLIGGISIATITFGCWYYLITAGFDQFTARNFVFLLMVLMQNIHVFNCRSEYKSAFAIPLKHNHFLAIGVIAAQCIHLLAMQIPLMQDILKIAPVSLTEWWHALAIAIVILIIMEFYKLLKLFLKNQLPKNS